MVYAFQQCRLYPGCPNRRRNTKTQSGGETVPFSCAFTMSWWKPRLLLPHNYFVQARSSIRSQIICSPAKTSLTKRQGFSGSCEEKYCGALWLCWGFNILPLWRMQCWDFPRGLSGPGELSRDFFVQKARIYELLQRWPHKNERPLSQYRHSEHTDMIYIYTEAKCLCRMTEFLTVWQIHIQ